VTIKNDMIHFGDKAAFPRKTQTSYRSQRVSAAPAVFRPGAGAVRVHTPRNTRLLSVIVACG
jgi:hypothetical protein